MKAAAAEAIADAETTTAVVAVVEALAGQDRNAEANLLVAVPQEETAMQAAGLQEGRMHHLQHQEIRRGQEEANYFFLA